MRLALFQPDIPQNAGTLIRLGACLGVAVDVIEPCGFPFADKGFRRAGMDYLEQAEIARHVSWDAFRKTNSARLVLVAPDGSMPYTEFSYRPSDTLMLGPESAGFPASIRAAVSDSVRIPMRAGLRSINVALAGAIVLGEALRQTKSFP